ncbi:MAG: penicillin acylase family protein [Bryobacteraceae bacterium]
MILLLAALAAIWWFAIRVLPRTSGSLRAPVSRPVMIARDERGVPHIRAATIEDALFAQGFATAQDRLFQMEFLRRQTAGELAQIFGRVAADSDIESIRMRMERLAAQHVARLSPEDRTTLAAYARGVNYFIDTHRGRLPVEFTVLRYQPRPWRVADTILVGLTMYRSLTTTWRDEILKQKMLDAGDKAKVAALFGSYSGLQPGSNAWAISGKWTKSGKPILANDPHLQFSLPGIWYQAHLEAPGLNVAGVTLPGVPCVIIGHNDRVAWGITNLHFDVQDLYQERTFSTAGVSREKVLVRGAGSVEAVALEAKHGPVIFNDGRRVLSLRWTAADALPFPFLELNRARDWPSFRAALSRLTGPPQNFVYADVDGNIGYQAAGALPLRKNHDGDVPVDGASPDFEWTSMIPFEEMPSAYNPPEGVIVTANQNPFPPDYRYRVHGNFAPPYRARQIRARLAKRRNWAAQEMPGIQTDVYSAPLSALARHVVAAFDRRRGSSSSLAGAVALLRKWNGQVEADLAAPMIATLVMQHVRKAFAERAAPGSGQEYDLQVAPLVVERLLDQRPPDWFEDYDQLLLRALVDAVEEGGRRQGRDTKKWRYGLINELALMPAVVGSVPVLGKYFRIGPVQLGGSTTTVKQTTTHMGPSMRFVADLADWEASLMNITTGQSGQVFSRHYRDQWDAYAAGRSFLMRYRRIDAKSTLELTP